MPRKKCGVFFVVTEDQTKLELWEAVKHDGDNRTCAANAVSERERRWLDKFHVETCCGSLSAHEASREHSAGKGLAACGRPLRPETPVGVGRAPLFKSHIATQQTENRKTLSKSWNWDREREEKEGAYFISRVGGTVTFSRYNPGIRANPPSDDRAEVSPWEMKAKPKRERIKEFSQASRRRLCQKLAQVDWREWCDAGVVVHANLTYPDAFPSPEVAKTHLEAFRERVRRRYGLAVGFTWKIEPQERGAPHFHLLGGIMQAGHIPTRDRAALFHELREMIIESWLAVVGSDDHRHALHHRVDPKVVQWVQDRDSSHYVTRYLGQYQGKAAKCGDWEWTGRWWGLLNGETIQDMYVRGYCVQVSRSAWYTAKRRLRKHGGPRSLRKNRAARSIRTWRSYMPEGGAGGSRGLDGIVHVAEEDPVARVPIDGFI